MILAFMLSKEEKLLILKESLKTWNLLENIDRTVLEIRQFAQNIFSKVKFDDDLERYVQDVKETIKILSQL